MECTNEIFHGGGLKVLLIDKDPKSLMYMSNILQEHSYQVTTTKTGFVALDMIVKSMFDLVICEIDLQGMDGFELLKQITSKVAIPVLLISASDDTQLASKAAEEGASYFFHKPIGIHNLVNIWRHFFNYSLQKHKLSEGFNPTEVEKFLHGVHGKAKSSSVLGKFPLSESLAAMRNDDEPNDIVESSQSSKEIKDDAPAKVTRNSSSLKKKEKTRRVKWTRKLQQKFQEAYEALGHFRATPSRIKQLMNEPDLKLHHINSYLQKFRTKMKEEKQEEATKNGMATQNNNSGATKNGMQQQNQKLVLRSPTCLGTYPSSLHSSLPPYPFNPHLTITRPNYCNIRTPGNLVQILGPNYNIQTTEAPNMVNAQNNIGLGEFVSGGNPQLLQELNGGLGEFVSGGNPQLLQELNGGLGEFVSGENPQLLQELNGGLGMAADDFGSREGNAVSQNGDLAMIGDDIDDLSLVLTIEDMEEVFQHLPDDHSGKDALSPGGNVSACSVTRPLTPQIGNVTGGEKVAESSIDNLGEEDMNEFIGTLFA